MLWRFWPAPGMRKGFDERFKAEKDADVKTRMLAVRMYKTPNADGTRNTFKEVANSLGMSIAWVSKHVARYDREGIDGLCDRPRPGAPRTVDRKVVSEILGGWKTGRPTSRKIADEYHRRTGKTVSRSCVRQIARKAGFAARG